MFAAAVPSSQVSDFAAAHALLAAASDPVETKKRLDALTSEQEKLRTLIAQNEKILAEIKTQGEVVDRTMREIDRKGKETAALHERESTRLDGVRRELAAKEQGLNQRDVRFLDEYDVRVANVKVREESVGEKERRVGPALESAEAREREAASKRDDLNRKIEILSKAVESVRRVG